MKAIPKITTVLEYRPRGADRVRRAMTQGWFCVWEYQGGRLIPGYWEKHKQRGKKQPRKLVVLTVKQCLSFKDQLDTTFDIRHAMKGGNWVDQRGNIIAKLKDFQP